jgi:elongation factor G
MDRTGANFERTVDMIVDRLGAKPVCIQMPIGAEDRFRGIIDLIEFKACLYTDDLGRKERMGRNSGRVFRQVTEQMRTDMIERISETDDELTMLYLESQVPDADQLRLALRKATLAERIGAGVVWRGIA